MPSGSIVLRTGRSARAWLAKRPGPVVLVPTMGALHSGHATLIRLARKNAGPSGTVIVSVFVNPTQFGPGEDFSNYPRSFSADVALCAASGADAVFAPDVSGMYAGEETTIVEELRLSGPLCGRSRPGHFRGVCTVVAKLLNIIQPEIAVFGEKDWQQLAVLRRMVRDLRFPVKIVACPTARETDGLAISSRNTYLTPTERSLAPQIYAAMRAAAKNPGSPRDVAACALQRIAAIPGARVDYVEVVDSETLEAATDRSRPSRLAVAVGLGKARLIDNIAVPPIKIKP